MSTVAELVDRVAKFASLNVTAASSDRALCVDWLNQAVQETIAEVRGNVVPLSVVVSGSDIALSSLGITRFDGFQSLVAGSTVMVASSPERIRELRTTSSTASAGVIEYAVEGGSLLLLYPTQTAATISGSYVQSPLTLVESSPVANVSETTPSEIDAPYHHALLSAFALSLAFSYKKNPNESDHWQGRYNEALERYKRFLTRKSPMANTMGPQYESAPARDYYLG
jgi:hypothetical protein